MRTTMPLTLTALALTPAALAQFGGWGPATAIVWPQSFQVKAIRFADMDGDGMCDVVALSQTSSGSSPAFAVVAGAGGGAFYPPVFVSTTGGTAQAAFAVFDVDADSLPDVVVLESAGTESDIVLYRNLGGMSFADPIRTPVEGWVNTSDMAVCDINGDGDLDIAISGLQYANLWLALNDGAGALIPLQSVAVSEARLLATGDLNGDGNDDILVTHGVGSGAGYTVLLNNGTGGIGIGHSGATPDTLEGIDLFDVEGDGDLDLVGSYGSGASGSLLVDRNNGVGQFGTRSIVPAGTGGNVAHRPGAVTADDLDGDGDQDLLVVGGLDRIVAHFNDGDGLFGNPLSVGASPSDSATARLMAVADFDGNSSPDVVTASLGSSPLHIRLNQTDILAPGAFDLLTPADGAQGLPLPGEPSWAGANGVMTWQPAAGFTVQYRAQIATDPAFANIVFESTPDAARSAAAALGVLGTDAQYYWRVLATSAGGETASTSVYSFRTRFRGDTDADQDVDFTDLNNLLSNYGNAATR